MGWPVGRRWAPRSLENDLSAFRFDAAGPAQMLAGYRSRARDIPVDPVRPAERPGGDPSPPVGLLAPSLQPAAQAAGGGGGYAATDWGRRVSRPAETGTTPAA